MPKDILQATLDLQDAQRRKRELQMKKGTPGETKKAITEVNKKIKAAQAALKEAQAEVDKKNKQNAEYLKRVDESLGKAKKSGKTKKARGGKSRSTRRRM